jgi:hypothetical protein
MGGVKITTLTYSATINKIKKRFRNIQNNATPRGKLRTIISIPRNCSYSLALRDLHNMVFTGKVAGGHIFE